MIIILLPIILQIKVQIREFTLLTRVLFKEQVRLIGLPRGVVIFALRALPLSKSMTLILNSHYLHYLFWTFCLYWGIVD